MCVLGVVASGTGYLIIGALTFVYVDSVAALLMSRPVERTTDDDVFFEAVGLPTTRIGPGRAENSHARAKCPGGARPKTENAVMMVFLTRFPDCTTIGFPCSLEGGADTPKLVCRQELARTKKGASG